MKYTTVLISYGNDRMLTQGFGQEEYASVVSGWKELGY